MKCYVYLLECKDKDEKITYYCGYTSKSPSVRLKAHINNVKKEKKKHYTGKQKSVRLVYYETYEDKKIAMKREREIKKLGSRYKLRLIHGMKNMSKKKK
jgi:putative endonuclease|tara:strand:+ start:1711 stop:2007 length:297 start_codon:yes stop_codon:yes gene_type:complete